MSEKPRPKGEQPQGAAAALFNGLRALEAFSIETPVLGVTEIANKINLHKSTVSRILTGLTEAGYVQRDFETGRYRLGLGVIALSGPLLADLDVRRAALPYLEELSEQTQETSAISVWNGSSAIVVEQVPSTHQVKHSAPIGTRYSKLDSSSVRVFLSELPEDKISELLENGVITQSDHAFFSGEPLKHLGEVREAGVAINDGYTTDEEFGVSAPVRDFRGTIVGCITVSAPRSRVHKQKAAETLVTSVINAAARVSARLGTPST
ncbi:IclR family transcriptional regulator [Neomicrococcus lactis]|uniref:DNA-binding IclR family transcriptional regulator n=1 Tax=Neomicrococcus lactis TaxID=732241 RepID=A0A7W9DCA5_9MICC|nr:IclR family transcriptional regulator [Neomicrococcus lactis]MBB5599329.1 DNA-binding IclR family transcriptional regulator [Neomicrococcus lactis]